MPPSHHSQHKNAEVADYYSHTDVRTTVPRVQVMKIWPLPGLVMSSPPSCPTAQVQTQLPGSVAGKESPPFSNSPQLSHKPACPSLQKQPSRASPQASLEDTAFLCAASLVLRHKLKKICLELFLEFPLYFYRGEAKYPNASHSTMNTRKPPHPNKEHL